MTITVWHRDETWFDRPKAWSHTTVQATFGSFEKPCLIINGADCGPRIGARIAGITLDSVFEALCQFEGYRELIKPEWLKIIDRNYQQHTGASHDGHASSDDRRTA